MEEMKLSSHHVLAVDIGTSSVRAMVFDVSGEIVAKTQIGYATVRPLPYFEEQDPEFVRQEVYRAIGQCLAEPAADPAKIEAVSFSSQMYGVIAVDEQGKPLTRNILWSDGRAEKQAARLKKEDTEHALYRETGCPINSIYPIAKILWLREHLPQVFQAARRFISIKEYVAYPLIGEWAIDYSMASGTGLFDITKKKWSETAIQAAGIDTSRLSRTVSGIEAFPLKADSPLISMGLQAGITVFLGGGDGPLANLGSGASGLGAVNIDLGTSGAARCITDKATFDDTASLWCYCLTDDIWAYGGIVTNVGNAYQWLGSNLFDDERLSVAQRLEALDQLAAETAIGSDDLYFMPYLRKARSPYWDGRLKGTVYGLTPDHGKAHLARALLEAIAYDLKAIIDLMKEHAFIKDYLVLTGGLSKSNLIRQLLADVIGIEVRTPQDGEGSIAGAAILALYGLGAVSHPAFSSACRAYQSYIPDRESVQRYEAAYQRYQHLIAAMRQIDLFGEDVS